MIPGGGYRNPSSPETLREKVVDKEGNIRCDEQGSMNGVDVLSFVISEVPRDIKKLFSAASCDISDVDYYVFHQANNFINAHVAKRLKLDKARIPTTISKYGNTSSVSVPLTMVSELRSELGAGEKRAMLSAFGAGLTWGTAILSFKDCRISKLVEI